MIKVVIVDDHAILRRGLTQIITESADMQVVGEADSSAAAMRLLRENPCNVLLLDITLPDRNGIETLKLVRKEFPKIRVLILSMHPENQYAVRALKAGAAGYLTKQSAPAQLVSAIRQVQQGRKYVTPAVAEELAQNVDRDADQPLHQTLSNREFQTLCMIASGKSLTDIALQMSLSVKTVSVYRARLLEKMRLKNNAELTHYAIKNQLVQ
jgi:DNA-binding NarL/FixJ family response regulator